MEYQDLDDMVELTKISDALKVAEWGELKQFKGKNFSDTKLDPMKVEPEALDEAAESNFEPSKVDLGSAYDENDSQPKKKPKISSKTHGW